MQGKRGIALLVAAGLVAVAAAAWWLAPGDIDDREAVLAEVGEDTITLARFNRSYLQYLLATGSNDTPAARRGHLDRLIQERLLAQQARQEGIGLGAEYEAHVERHRLQAAGARYFEQEYAETLPPLTEAQVRDAYEKGHQTLILRQLYFSDPERARSAFAQLEEGRDFVDLANEVFNTAVYDTLAGFLGEATYWQMDDAVAEAVFDLPVGTYSSPVRSEHGWHIVLVEERLRNPLLIEEDFQRRREGIEGRARIRRNRLQGDAWVRNLMESLEVNVNEQGMRLLARAVSEAVGTEQPDPNAAPQPLLTVEEFDLIRDQLRPDTPLLVYEFGGRDVTFTASDFFRWVPELAYDEIRNSPAAAVGRALRNEVLGQLGAADGLDRDPYALEAIDFAADRYLANRMKDHLRELGDVEPTDEEVEEAFDRLGYGRILEARGSWWIIPFDGYPEADSALRAISAGRSAAGFPGYRDVDDGDLLAGRTEGHLRRIALGEPAVVCLADGSCVVAEVRERHVRRRTIEEARSEIESLLRRVLPEERMTDSLRRATRIRVDEELFQRNLERR